MNFKTKCKCGRDNRPDNTHCYHCGERLCYAPIPIGEYPAPKPTRFELNMYRSIPIEQAIEGEQFPPQTDDTLNQKEKIERQLTNQSQT